jgi:hypothetical protein
MACNYAKLLHKLAVQQATAWLAIMASYCTNLQSSKLLHGLQLCPNLHDLQLCPNLHGLQLCQVTAKTRVMPSHCMACNYAKLLQKLAV